MPDEAHVRSAIRFFNYCDEEDEARLAAAIKRKIKKFGMTDISVSEKNRFSKYYKSSSKSKADKPKAKSTKESTVELIPSPPMGITEGYNPDDEYIITENCMKVNNPDSSFFIFFNEAEDEKAYSQRLRRYLYRERIKTNKDMLTQYMKVKAGCPIIRKTYIKMKLYKGFNVFVDLSYYNALFIKNNIYKMDKAVNMYWDFINRLIDNTELTSDYKKQTIYIPVDPGCWPNPKGGDIFDYKSSINPISVIFRLLKVKPDELKKWKDKEVIFLGSRGYFKVDFGKFALKNRSRFINNIKKLMSDTEPIVDEEDPDDKEDQSDYIEDIHGVEDGDSHKVIVAKIIDKIEDEVGIKIDDISDISTPIGIGNSQVNTVYDIPEKKVDKYSFNLTTDKNIPERGSAVLIMAPNTEAVNKTIKSGLFRNAKEIKAYIKP
jgi:hypothetical protein